jgi:hypothetical protein
MLRNTWVVEQVSKVWSLERLHPRVPGDDISPLGWLALRYGIQVSLVALQGIHQLYHLVASIWIKVRFVLQKVVPQENIDRDVSARFVDVLLVVFGQDVQNASLSFLANLHLAKSLHELILRRDRLGHHLLISLHI